MLAGLAAGLGLAWLASALGLGDALGVMLMMLLGGVVLLAALGWFMRNRARQASVQRSLTNEFGQGGFAFAGGAGSSGAYNPEKVGNDASARPWERNSMSFQSSKFKAELRRMPSAPIAAGMEGFDEAAFLNAAKSNFVSLQAAWDQADMSGLRSMMTDEMVREISGQLQERETSHSGRNQTDVMALEAKLLGAEGLNSFWLASVEFSGVIQEDAAQGPQPFREVWSFHKSKDGSSGWLVAGVQALG
jgi:predicted lipid-binding transport protein (Tim44 family)